MSKNAGCGRRFWERSFMEKFVERTLLYDFYGELLTTHQKQIYEEYALDNLSVSEIAKEHEVSRQSVHDQIKRTEKLLDEYEGTLHLVEKFLAVKNKVNSINRLSKDILVSGDMEEVKRSVSEIDRLSKEIIEEL